MTATWGELAEQGEPITEAFALIMKLAAKRKQLPVTKGLGPGQCWTPKLPNGWTLYMNGWQHDAVQDGHKVPAFHALAVRDGLPLLLFGPFGGSQIDDGHFEDSLIAALQEALQ